MNIADFRGDAALETGGKWIKFEDGEFLIAANMNPNHKKALQRLARKNPLAIRKNDIAAQERIAAEAMAETVILDWRGLKDGDKDFPYNRENAIKLLAIPIIRDFIAEESQRISNFQAEAEGGAIASLKSGAPVGSNVGGQ
jgi:hypothetical protein